jgi:hypothetical protein
MQCNMRQAAALRRRQLQVASSAQISSSQQSGKLTKSDGANGK